MPVPPCAHRCDVLQQQIEARARGAGQQPVVLRLSIGLTPQYVPPIAPPGSVRCVECGHTYRTGGAFYQLSKSEKVQPKKQISVLEKKTDRIYTGPEARALLGLPDVEVRIKPDHNDEFTIFVQSTSVNRKLVPNTRLLLML